MNEASGGGGAGHGTDGNVGGDRGAAVKGGALGPTVNAAGALLGGSGGGHGGGYVAGLCSIDQGRGGAGGGALQISTAGKIVVGAFGGIDVGGGGGTGGCKSGGGDKRTGGGGGGAGGLVFLEAVEGITIALGATLEASGGGGGGGGSGSPGGDGQDGPYPIGTASGGSGNGGGSGSGGSGGSVSAPPQLGASGSETAGGGGGATGRVFLRTRGATPSVSGLISAQRTDDPTF